MAGGIAGAAYRRIYSGVNYRMRSFAGGALAGRCRPVAIMLLLTERCNARCVHCDIWKNKGKEDSPDTSEWKHLLDDLRKWLGPVDIVFTGGEALLKQNTTELARHAVSLGFALEVLTHGYWEDQSKIEKLAAAKPHRITISLDGIGETHSKVRGRDDFFEKTQRTIETLVRMREHDSLGYQIRLKTVIMEHNLGDLANVARFATRPGMEVFYQPIEQNYNTPEDPEWFRSSPNWPRDPSQAVRAVRELQQLHRDGLHIANSQQQLEVMVRYFEDPEGLRLTTQAHQAHERQHFCSSLGTLQIQSDGGVGFCARMPVVGNFRAMPIRQIWETRPRWWESGCCMSQPRQGVPEPLHQIATDGASHDSPGGNGCHAPVE
ncbi:MAG: radical SAM protein [Acidobacteria bacterium]|nr:radical SAM protein [Acidobacteriota bacterium]